MSDKAATNVEREEKDRMEEREVESFVSNDVLFFSTNNGTNNFMIWKTNFRGTIFATNMSIPFAAHSNFMAVRISSSSLLL